MRPLRFLPAIAAGVVVGMWMLLAGCGAAGPQQATVPAATTSAAPTRAASAGAPAATASCNGSAIPAYQPDSTPGSLLPGGAPGQDIWDKMEHSAPGISDSGLMTMLPPIGRPSAHVRAGVICPNGDVYIGGHKVAAHIKLITLTKAGGKLVPILSSVNDPTRLYYAHITGKVIRGPCPALIEYIPAPSQLGHQYDYVRAVCLDNGDVAWYNNGA
jgi:hypothetical protein